MKSSIVRRTSFGLLALMALTTGCSKSDKLNGGEATADGQKGRSGGAAGAGANRPGTSAVTIAALELPQGLELLPAEVNEETARASLSESDKAATYAGSVILNGTGALNGTVVELKVASETFVLSFPDSPILVLPVTVSIFDARKKSLLLGLAASVEVPMDVDCDTSQGCTAVAGALPTNSDCLLSCKSDSEKCEKMARTNPSGKTSREIIELDVEACRNAEEACVLTCGSTPSTDPKCAPPSTLCESKTNPSATQVIRPGICCSKWETCFIGLSEKVQHTEGKLLVQITEYPVCCAEGYKYIGGECVPPSPSQTPWPPNSGDSFP